VDAASATGCYRFLSGGGEMAALINAYDWAATPLGPLSSWPLPVCTTMGLILRSPVPIVTLWGKEGTMIYNDAYSRFAGGRHPQLLGSAVRRGWPEVADFNDNVMKVVLAGGVLSYRDLELTLHRRDGQPEQVFMNLDYSPVIGEQGEPIGVIAIVVETTEHVRADRRVRESEDRFRTIADAAPVMMWISDSAHGCTWFNKPWLDFTGRSLSEEIGEGWLDNLHPDDREAVLAKYDASFAAFTPFHIDFRIRRHDGVWRTVEETGAPQVAPDGSLINFLGCCNDVTEQREAETALRESAERLRLATTAASIGTWDYHPKSGVLRWDDRCKALFGLPPDAEVTYDGVFLAGLHPDDRARTHAAVMRALSSNDPKPFDMEYRTIGVEDGKLRWVAATGTAFFEHGEAVRFVGTVRDITARKRIENHLRILNDTGAAVAAERELDTIVQIVTDAGVMLSGAQFGAFFYNVMGDDGGSYMLYALSGAPREAFAAYPMPRATDVFKPTFLGQGVVRSDDILLDPRYGHNAPHAGMPEGHLPVRSYLAVPVVSRSGEVLGGLFFGHGEPGRFTGEHESALLGIAGHAATAIDNANLFAAAERELAERRRAEEALQVLNATLEERVRAEVAERTRAEEQLRQAQKMEAIGNLTGGVAHDFNNLLTVVLGNLERLRRRLPDDPALLKLVDNAVEGAERGSALTQRMLAFARRQDLKMRDVDAQKLVMGMTELLQRSLGPMIVVDTDFPPRLPTVSTDPNQLESALLNLAVNARDAMEGTGRITISGREEIVAEPGGALRPGRYVCISVVDTGEGMDEETLTRSTEPFFTTKGVGKGTGLGLSMVQGLAEQSGGALTLQSRPGVGTTAEIRLPVAAQEEEPAPTAPARPEPVAAVSGKRALRVLCVDDDTLVLMNTTAMLEELGHEVIEAHSGAQALDLFEREPVDLVITDHAMPKMTGSELAQALRARRPEVPILLATGYAERTPGVADDLPRLAKPFWQADLQKAIRRIFGCKED
jgi:PAS domain S-box-containing protein